MHWKALYLYYTISLHINFIHSIHIYSRRYNLIFIIKKISDLFHAFLQVSNTCISIQFEAGERPFVISSIYRSKPTLVESVPWLQVLLMTGRNRQDLTLFLCIVSLLNNVQTVYPAECRCLYQENVTCLSRPVSVHRRPLTIPGTTQPGHRFDRAQMSYLNTHL